MERSLTVGQLAQASGVAARTIRYYEEIGVLPAADRRPSGYRQYTGRDVDRLVFVRRARALGLSLAEVKMLSAEAESRHCSALRSLVAAQLSTVRQRIGEFQALERQLSQVLQRLDNGSRRPGANGCGCLDELPAG